MKLTLDYDRRQLLTHEEELKALAMPAAKRKRLLWRIARSGIIAQAKRNVKQQQTPKGVSWKARARGKRKMLSRLPRLLTPQDTTDKVLVVRFKRGVMAKSGISMGALGEIQQDGKEINQTAAQARRWSKGDPNRQCTMQQARRLKKLGYQRRVAGKGYTTATMAWIRANLSWRQAGVIIRKMQARSPKESWKINIPSREFLGVTPEQLRKMIVDGFQGIDYGWQVKAQDIKGR